MGVEWSESRKLKRERLYRKGHRHGEFIGSVVNSIKNFFHKK